MRIVSLLPSATDIVVALGAAEDLVGVSHSCSGNWDHLPKLTSTWIDTTAPSAEIDRQVTTAVRPLYELDLETLHRLAPDVIVSQSLCDVCAVPSGDVREAVLSLASKPVLVDLAPNRLADVRASFGEVGAALGRAEAARALALRWDDALEAQRARHAGSRLKVVFLDWLDPPFVSGHWIPEMVELLGLTNVLGRAGERSYRVTWDEVRDARPDVLVVAACGFGETRAQLDAVPLDIPVIHLDGHLHFSRPSPALLPSLEMLSEAVADFMLLA
jgi:iron complex transport system substrate-binding protein